MSSKNETSTVKKLAVLLFVLKAIKTFECYKLVAFTYIALGEYSNQNRNGYFYWLIVVFHYLQYYLGFVTLSKGDDP